MFGERLKELRKKKMITQLELGKRFNLGESTISGYEHNTRKPNMDVVVMLADFFDVSTDYLIGRDDDDSSIKKTTIRIDSKSEDWNKNIQQYKSTVDGIELDFNELSGAIAYILTSRETGTRK